MDRRGAVLLLRLNRPEARNALTLVDDRRHRRRPSLEAEADPEIRALVLTGTGDRAFCSGMDLRSFADGDVPGSTPGERRTAFYAAGAPARSSVPVVGAANASAVAGGFELLLGCDVVVASSRGAASGCPR